MPPRGARSPKQSYGHGRIVAKELTSHGHRVQNWGMTENLTYYGDPALKAALIADMKAHQEADRLEQRNWFSDGRGCAIGCTVATWTAADEGVSLGDLDDIGGVLIYERWSRITGLPQWLAALDDLIFEGLDIDDARKWPVALLQAVPVGVDLEPASRALIDDLLFDPVYGMVILLTERPYVDPPEARELMSTRDPDQLLQIIESPDRFAYISSPPIRSFAKVLKTIQAEPVTGVVEAAETRKVWASAYWPPGPRAYISWLAARVIHHCANS